MRKVINKLKKIIFFIGVLLMSLPSKIFATNVFTSPVSTLYGIPETVYESSPVSPVQLIWRIAKGIVIPLILLVGLITYLKKSKSSKKKKILVTIGIIAITAIIYFVVNKIIWIAYMTFKADWIYGG